MATSSSPINWSILAGAVLVFALFAAGDQPPEITNNQRPPELRMNVVKFHLWCMTRSPNYTFTLKAFEIDGCKYSYQEVQNRYQWFGILEEEYLEAVKIFNNYNQTDVDIHICNLDSGRCPDRIKALNTWCTSTYIKLGLYGCEEISDFSSLM